MTSQFTFWENRFWGLFISTLIILSCGKVLDTVNIRNQDNVVVEKYFIDKDSLKQGVYLSFYDNGIDTFEFSYYENDLLEGPRIIYYESGIPEIEEFYLSGVLDGPFKTFHTNGGIELSGAYKLGVLSGVLSKYYVSGSILEEVYFSENIENGPFKEYYENGSLKWSGSYLNGDNEFGELKNYNEAGELIRIMYCDSQAVCRTTWTIEKGNIALKPIFND